MCVYLKTSDEIHQTHTLLLYRISPVKHTVRLKKIGDKKVPNSVVISTPKSLSCIVGGTVSHQMGSLYQHTLFAMFHSR